MNVQQFLTETIFFTTREFATCCHRSVDSSSRTLVRLAKAGTIEQVTRGVWANTRHPYFSPYGAIPYLLRNEQGYVSFLTALHRHGLISQIPSVIQVATTGHGRKLKSSIGEFEFFQLRPEMMRIGIEVFSGKGVSYNLATAEKALLDVFYLSTRKGRRFNRLPELDLEGLNKRKFISLLNEQVSSVRIQSAMMKRFRSLI